MEFGFEGKMPFRRNRFGFVTGTIVELVPTKVGNRRADGCMLFTTVEDMDGNTVNFVVTPSTYVVDFETLSIGMPCTFWYSMDAPMPLIYPPQYNAVVAAVQKNGRMINVGYYDTSFVNAAEPGRQRGGAHHQQPIFSGKSGESQLGSNL